MMPDPALHARLSALIKATAKRYPYGSDIDEGCDAIADAILASEEWQAREAVVEAAENHHDHIHLLDEERLPCAVCIALARLAAVRRTT